MNIKCVLLTSLFSLTAPLAFASETGPSTREQSLGTCVICQQEITPEAIAAGEVASGRELYGCSDRHLFHSACMVNPDSTLTTQCCPICRATRHPEAAQEEVNRLGADYSAYFPAPWTTADHTGPAPISEPTPLQLAIAALASAPTPAGVQPETWHKVCNMRFNFLNLDGLHITSDELAVFINALPQIIKESITHLILSDNQLTNLPETIEQLTNLKYLCLSSNHLRYLPDSIGQLISLRELYLDYNRLIRLPETIGRLTALEVLRLSSNYLGFLPDVIGQLTHLKELNITHNKLTRLPETIGQLAALIILNLSNNRLTYLPESIMQLTARINTEHQLSAITLERLLN